MKEYTKIAVLDNQFQAQLLESILMERKIPHLLRSYYDTAFDGLFQTQKGGGVVKEILRDLRENSE